MSERRERIRPASWIVMAVVAVGALVVGAVDDEGSPSVDDRVENIAATIRCPTCRGQSVADSDATQARQVREEIRERVEEGQSGDEIRAYFATAFGEELLLTPPSSGVGSLVWVIPVAALVAAAIGLGLAFARWRRWS